MANKLVRIDSVDQDYDVLLVFTKINRTVQVVTAYQGAEQSRNNLSAPHGEPLTYTVPLPEGLQIAGGQTLPGA